MPPISNLTNSEMSLVFFNTIVTTNDGTLTYENGVYKLHSNVEINETYALAYADVQMTINNLEVFDGNNHTITLNYATKGFFKINSSSIGTTIKNIKIYSATINGADESGGIVSNSNSNFTLKHCKSNINMVNDNSGGIVGSSCYNFIVKKCTNVGNFNDDKKQGNGGIIGANCYNYHVYMCTNRGDFTTHDSGGICGSNNYNAKIIKCKNYGIMTNEYCGGIVGSNFHNYNSAYNAYTKSEIYKCINYGEIYTSNSAGICGQNLGKIYLGQSYNIIYKSQINIVKCKNLDKTIHPSNGICSDNVGIITFNTAGLQNIVYKLKSGLKIKIKDCYSYKGNICGLTCLTFTGNIDLNQIKYKGTKLIISDTYTKKSALVLGSIGNPCSSKAIYKRSEKKINLLKHPFTLSKK